jgi:hypothetical protein
MAHSAFRKAHKAAKLPPPIKAWAGVVDGKIHRWGQTQGSYYVIYSSRAMAKRHYEQVVRINITPSSE